MTSNSRIKNIEEAKRLLQAQKLAQAEALEKENAIALKQAAEKAEEQRLADLFKAAVKDARPLSTDTSIMRRQNQNLSPSNLFAMSNKPSLTP